ncbi:MAG: DUF4097 family beta strand repeat protein [Oscillospiraceae bacterium]|nr:DUF4097 family beta strand repeat protein [Oscillospiraceae bacterium]
MKTGKKIALLVGILLLALGLTALQFAHHRGEISYGNLPNMTVFGSSSSSAYDQKGYTILTGGEKSFSAGDVKALDLDWVSGSVSVERWDGKDVVVREKAAVRLSEDQSLRWKLSGGTLSILPCANNLRDLPNKDLTVLVPQGLTLEGVNADSASASVLVAGIEISGKLSLDAASGSLRVEGCVCGGLDLDSASGGQTVLRTTVSGDVTANAASGSFTAELLDCGKLDVETASGAVRAEDLFCSSVDIDTASGAVSLGFDAAPGKVEIETASGAVTLAFPKGTGLDLDFDTASGKLRGEVVYGGLPVDVDTTSGSLTIEYK